MRLLYVCGVELGAAVWLIRSTLTGGGISLGVFFFFSSRRRHTRLTCDWSSDVCSSDLDVGHLHRPYTHVPHQGVLSIDFGKQSNLLRFDVTNDMLRPTAVVGTNIDQTTRAPLPAIGATRSEERRVGKESRPRWGAEG